ncbi:MAG TPA: hypothetical protein VK183_02730 [Flavobacterium sp.]|nr:hypothetical protein [Flavobacterium sp.]
MPLKKSLFRLLISFAFFQMSAQEPVYLSVRDVFQYSVDESEGVYHFQLKVQPKGASYFDSYDFMVMTGGDSWESVSQPLQNKKPLEMEILRKMDSCELHNRFSEHEVWLVDSKAGKKWRAVYNGTVRNRDVLTHYRKKP